MGFIDPTFAGEVPFERLVDEPNNDWAALTYQAPGEDEPRVNTPAVVSLGRAVASGGNGPRYSQGGTVFLPRGIDRKSGDRFTYNGAKYRLVGRPAGDQDHPVTGDDFGWVTWSFEGSG
ncbi:hypothetical protein B1R94_25975 [Mycolicibacterium litorale]|nr:hypothetical protein B1R94_25975 [Mycolicibacterium litorale]